MVCLFCNAQDQSVRENLRMFYAKCPDEHLQGKPRVFRARVFRARVFRATFYSILKKKAQKNISNKIFWTLIDMKCFIESFIFRWSYYFGLLILQRSRSICSRKICRCFMQNVRRQVDGTQSSNCFIEISTRNLP